MKNQLKLMLVAVAMGLLFPSQLAAQPVSNRCFTPHFWCWLPGYGPVGANCYCATPYGPVGGVIR